MSRFGNHIYHHYEGRDKRGIVLGKMRAYYRKRRDHFYSQGLRCDGKPRKTRVWSVCGEEGRSLTSRKAEQQRIRRAEFVAQGLTIHGQPRKYRWDAPELRGLTGKARDTKRKLVWQKAKRARVKLSPLDKQWRELRSTVSMPEVDYFAHLSVEERRAA